MKFLSIWTNFSIDSMFFFRKLHYLKLHYWAIAKMKICNRSPWKSYSKGIKKVIKYLRDENNSKQQQFLSKNLGTSLGSLIENLSLLCECPTSLISKHFLLSLLLGVSTFQTLKIIRISIFIEQTEHFRSWNDQMLFILLLLTFSWLYLRLL